MVTLSPAFHFTLDVGTEKLALPVILLYPCARTFPKDDVRNKSKREISADRWILLISIYSHDSLKLPVYRGGVDTTGATAIYISRISP